MAEIKAKVINIKYVKSESEKSKGTFSPKDLTVIAVTAAAVIAEMLTFGKLFGMGLVLRAIIGALIIISSIFGFMIEVDNEMLVTHIINMRRNRVDIRPYCKRGTFDVPVGAEASISDTKKVEGIFIVGEDEAEMKKKKSKYEGKSICVPKTAQDTLPFEEVYEDGIVKVRENVYALVFAYTDIEYNKLTLDSKRRMVNQYHELLNSLPQNVTYQELIVNKPVDPKRYDREMMLKTKDNQEQEELVDSMNDIIAYYVSQSAKSTAEHLTYMALSYELLNSKDDLTTLHNTYEDISNVLEALGSKTRVLEPEETFKLMHDIYYPYEEFKLAKDIYARGENIRDYIAPNGFKFTRKYIELGDNHFMRVLAMRLSYDVNELTDSFIAKLLDNPYRVCVSKIVTRLDKNYALKQIRNDYGDAVERQDQIEKENSRRGVTGMSYTVSSRIKNLRNVHDEVNKTENELFRIALFVTISAESLEELDSLTDYIKQKATSSQVALNIIAGGQEKGIHSVMPFAVNHFNGSKTSYTTNLLTEAASVLIPFSTRVFYNPNGVCYGFEKVNKNLIAIDKDEGMNANTMMFGASGSGKSMLEKLTFIQMYLKHPDYRSIFIDPDGEYTHLLEEMGGVQINITPSSKTKINIFDIDLNYVDKDTQQDPISMKIDFMLMVVELAKKSPLTSSETSILNRCIKHLYQPYIKSGDEKDKPIFSDLYKMLKGQDEDDAKKLALDLEFYADSDYFFDGHTNIDMNNKLIQFNVKNIEKDKTMSLQIILELIWQTVNKNSKNGYRTIFVNDEVQTMLTDYTGQEATRSSKYYEETYRRIRKLGGIPTAIVQNISTFSKSTVGNAMMDNASMTILCQQGEADIEVAAARFKLTPEETKWVSSGVLGTGIIKVGQKKVMYDMRIPRKVRANSLVYELCATDPSK